MGSQNSTEVTKNQSNQKVQVGSFSQLNIISNQQSKPTTINGAKYKNSTQEQYFIKSPLSVFNNQLQKIYDQCGEDFEKFMGIVQKKVSQVYSQVSRKTLKKLNNYEINVQQSKVIISEEILSLNLNILKLIGKNNNMQHDKQTFKKINQFQRNLVGYLKIKYPRDKQTPVSNDLMDKFKQFDRVNDMDYDILKNCNTYFGQIQQKKIIKGIKIFINKLIDESNKSFPQFKDKMQKIFTKKNKEGLNISLNYKIGRKIPQNCPKYKDNLDKQDLQIFSPEIFRILIKWMEDLQMTIKNTSQMINKKQNFKCYLGEKKVKVINGNKISIDEKEKVSVQMKQIEEQKELEFNYINHYEKKTIVDELVSKINGIKQNLDEKNEKLLNLFYEFNERLLKVLNQANPQQKYVPTQQIETIIYSSFNSKFVEYILTQKLVFVIGELVKVGKSFIGKNSIILDVVKFRITDLLRCQVWSDSKGIKQIFDLFKEMQKNRQIKIIKIKNRLMTPMNDAMILFILEKSWLICEAQLILSQLEEKEDKISKNIANVNHYFYELERSPYGIMAQIAVLLTYRDNKIGYQKKIKFQSNNLDIKNCKRNHKQQVVQHQKQQIPFICSNCSMFYKKFLNVFRFYECKKCKIVICSKCFLKLNPQFENSFVMRKIKLQLQQRISEIGQLSMQKALDQYKKTEKKIVKKIYYKQILNLLQHLKIKFSEEFNKSKKQNNDKVSVLQLIQKLNEYYQISKQDDPRYFFVVKFLSGRTVFRLYCYNPQFKEILNPIDAKQKYDDKSYFSFSEYDLLCMFKKSLITREQSKKIEKNYLHLFITKNQLQAKKMQIQKNEKQGKIKVNQKYEIVSIQLKNSSALLLLDYVLKRNQKTIIKNQDTNKVVKKKFQYTSLKYMTDMIPDLDSAKSSIQFDNKGIQTFLLKHFQQLTWKDKIKQLKLANNKIDDITILLDELNSLQGFYFNDNYVKALKFKKKLPKLQILNGTNNKITQMKRLQNIPNIKKLLLGNNELKEFPQDIQLQYLNVLDLKGNYILNLNQILECKFPQLQQFIISQQYSFNVPNRTNNQVKSSRIDIKFSKLKNFENQQNESLLQNKTLVFQSQSLERISLNNSKINEILFRNNQDLRNLKYVYLHDNKIKYFNFLDQKNYSASNKQSFKQRQKKGSELKSIFNDNLIELILSKNQIQELPIMKFSSLKHLELQKNVIIDIKPFQLSMLPSLQYLDLGQNKFTDICIFKLPKLITLKLQKMNKLAKVNHLFDGSSQFSSLQNLYFTKTQQMYFNFNVKQKCLTKLKELRFNGVNFQSTTKQETTFQIPNLEKISFDNCSFDKFPKLILPKVKNLSIEKVKAQNLLNLQKSYLPELRNLSIQYLLLITQKKQQYFLIKEESDLKKIDLKNQFICDFGFNKLKGLKLQNIQLASLHGLNPHRYTQLESFQLKNTKIKQNQLPNLKAPNIKNITITASQIKQIDSFLSNKFPDLSILHLDNNKIQSISQQTLASMTKIKILSLSHNNLKRFFCNKNLDNLIMLDLSSNKITSFPRIKAKILTDIRWYKNPLNDLSQLQNCELPSLQILQFIDCELGQSGLPKINMQGLQTLIISKSWLKNIQNLRQSNLPALRQLDLSYNQIQSFPPVNLPKLENLYLEQNKIDDLSFFKISKLQNLHSFRINKNHFIKMPQNFQLQHLKIFQFSDMRIFSLPKLKLPQVQQISINQAKLANIEQFAKGQYRLLRYLDLSNNQISYLPSFQMESLTSFIFDSNKIEDLQNLFQSNFNLSLIERFSFQNNQIRNVPPIKFVNIKVIYLNNNPLEYFNSLTLPEYPYLHGIYLNKTKVKKIRLTARFPLLQKIDLKNTQVYEMNWLISQCLNYPRLEMIDMKNCYITKVPNLEQLKSLNRLQLLGNPVRNVELFLEQNFNQSFELNISLNVGNEFQKIKKSIQKKLSDAAVGDYKYNQ